MKESIEEAGRAAAHDLERFLTALGTIASIAPLLGLLGTVIGMVEIFGAQTPSGGNPAVLAHGISVALYNTAFGLIVAIPSMIFYRFFRTRVEALVVEMEQQAIKLVEMVHGELGNMNFQRGQHRDEPEINLIPMIDVLLVILIFLMVTTTYAKFSELQINLPQAAGEQSKEKPDPDQCRGGCRRQLSDQRCDGEFCQRRDVCPMPLKKPQAAAPLR